MVLLILLIGVLATQAQSSEFKMKCDSGLYRYSKSLLFFDTLERRNNAQWVSPCDNDKFVSCSIETYETGTKYIAQKYYDYNQIFEDHRAQLIQGVKYKVTFISVLDFETFTEEQEFLYDAAVSADPPETISTGKETFKCK